MIPPIDVDGPRVRLGLGWAVVSTVAVAAGPVTAALIFAPVALAAAGQACRSWKSAPTGIATHAAGRPFRPVAIGGATVCAMAGSSGPHAVVAAAVVVSVAAAAARQLRLGGTEWNAKATIAIGVTIGVGAAAPALIRDQLGFMPALVFLALVHAVDASAFIVGSGASSRWEGPVAGLASAAAIGLATAAVLVPPFRGVSPWVLAVIAAVLAPAGTVVASALLGRVEAPVPALRRLDSFLLAGPVWLLAGRLLLDLG